MYFCIPLRGLTLEQKVKLEKTPRSPTSRSGHNSQWINFFTKDLCSALRGQPGFLFGRDFGLFLAICLHRYSFVFLSALKSFRLPGIDGDFRNLFFFHQYSLGKIIFCHEFLPLFSAFKSSQIFRSLRHRHLWLHECQDSKRQADFFRTFQWGWTTNSNEEDKFQWNARVF